MIHGLKLQYQRPRFFCLSALLSIECLLYPNGPSCFGPKMAASSNYSHVVSCSHLEGGGEGGRGRRRGKGGREREITALKEGMCLSL